MWAFNLGHAFKNIARENQGRPALKFADRDYTYLELDRRSDQLAGLLAQRALKAGDVVILTSKKTFDTFALVVACWKSGLTYCFVDRFSPKERLEKIIKTTVPALVITDSELKARMVESSKIKLLDLGEIEEFTGPAEPPSLDEICSDALAYIMFTSGSTGTPKGVAISHEQVLRFAQWGRDEYGIQPGDTFSGLNSLFFDNSVFDLSMSFLNGAGLVPVTREDFKNTGNLLAHLDAKGVNTWFSVPSLLIYFLNLHSLNAQSLPKMKRIIFGGEGFLKSKLKELFELLGQRVQLFNVYGPTEGTCICSSYLITAKDFSEDAMKTLAPLGCLAKNFKQMIVDENNRAVADGVIGELLIGGSNISLGYYNDPLQTSGKFVQNPAHDAFRDIFYRTGDLVCVSTKDRLLYFNGRRDDQIKFMGYRIELAEIEAAVSSRPDVKEVAVTFGAKDGVPEITCFLSAGAAKSEIRASLQDVLPAYMVPRKFVFFDILPKNANGKVDKKKLASEYYD